MQQGSTKNLMDYGGGDVLRKYQWDLVHHPRLIIPWLQDDEGAAYKIAGEEELKKLLENLGANACGYCQRCDAAPVDGGIMFIKDSKKFRCSFGVLNADNTIEPMDADIISGSYMEVGNNDDKPTINDFVLSEDRLKFVLLVQGNEQELHVVKCDAEEDYGDYCNKTEPFSEQSFTDKVIADIEKCASLHDVPAEVREALVSLQSQARANQQFELEHEGKVYGFDKEGNPILILDPLSKEDINAGNWDDSSIEMKMRVGINQDGILQFTALGIYSGLENIDGKGIDKIEIAKNIRESSNDLFLQYQVKDFNTTLSQAGYEFSYEEFPGGGSVDINKDVTFIKFFSELGGITTSIMRTTEIEQPVYIDNYDPEKQVLRAPPNINRNFRGWGKRNS